MNLDNTLQTMQRNEDNMTRKYGTNWQADSRYGMQADMETMNAVTGGVFNRFSPTQNIGTAIDIVQALNGKKDWKSVVDGAFLGNSGIVSDKYAAEHPYMAMLANGAGDALVGYGMARGFSPKAIASDVKAGASAVKNAVNDAVDTRYLRMDKPTLANMSAA